MKFNSRIRRTWPKLKNSWIDILYFAKPFYVNFHSLFRYCSVSNCFLSPVLSKTTKYEERKFKKSVHCEKPDVKTCSACKEGFVSFPPYDRPLRPFLGYLETSFSKYGYAIVWREILMRACTSQWSQLFVARLGSINFV